MRVLTVRQPWGWAIIHGGKSPENRTRNIAGSYRGPVAIHAGLTLDEPGFSDPLIGDGRLTRWLNEHAEVINPFFRGHVIGVVDLTDVHHATACPGGIEDGEWMRPFCTPWAMADHWHLDVTNPRPLATPIPAKGRLGLWTPDDELRAQIEGQLREEAA